MDVLTHLSIDLFPIIILLIIWMDNEKKITRTADKWLLGVLALISIGLMLVNILISSLTGAGWTAGPFLWIPYILQALSAVTMTGTWLLCVCNRLFTGGHKQLLSLIHI